MRIVIASIKPKYAELIYSGLKTVEVRKTIPHPLGGWGNGPLAVLWYESGTGHVTGQSTMIGGQITRDEFIGTTCLTAEELSSYGTNKSGWFNGWSLKDALKFTAPVPLSVFGLSRPPQSWQYLDAPDRLLEKLEQYARRAAFIRKLGEGLALWPELGVMGLEYEKGKDPTGVYECETAIIIRAAGPLLERVDVTGMSLADITAEILREVRK